YPLADAGEQERDQSAEHDRQADVDDREHDRPHDRVPEDVVAEHRPVVVDPDPVSLVLDQLEETVPLERDPDELVDRVAEDHDHGGRDREDQPVGGERKTAVPPRRDEPRLGGNRLTRRDSDVSVPRHSAPYDAFSVYSMLLSAVAAACLTDSLPVRIWLSIVRRIFPFSTLTQFFAAGTNQLRRAARSPTLLVFRRLVAFGMLPAAWNAFSDVVLVKAAIQSAASCLLAPIGTARSEPPRKPGIAWPAVWLGITNCAVEPLYLSPTQQVNQPGPTIEPALPSAYTLYGVGRFSSVVLLALEAAAENFLSA